MPLYDYQCEHCPEGGDGIYELYFSYDEYDPEPPCPACDRLMVRYLGDAPAIHYKGSGFFSTDRDPRQEPHRPLKP